MSTTAASTSPMASVASSGTPPPGPGFVFGMDLEFHPADYVLFILMMLMSALIGVYYGCYKKQDSVSEYLHGGKTMSVLPVAMSLISSMVSGITMLAVPSEIYLFGTQFALLGLAAFPATLVVIYVIMPMFFNLQCNSSFEYLELRFSRGVRQLASFLFALGQLLYMPVVIYVPCLALNQVSGISVHLISPIACLVCIFYTTLGGLKAVVWTDALQLFVLVLASMAVIFLGLIRVGGAGVVVDRAQEAGRLELFNMDPSLYTRCTFWNVGLGGFFSLVINLGASPSSVQRFLSVPSLAAARKTCWIVAGGFFCTKMFSVVTGLIIFASYFYCDPLSRDVGVVKKSDQLVPYYVMDVARSWPGLSGLFVAGVFSAALSTMSASLNTLSCTLYTDFIERLLPNKVSDERASTHMKMVSLVIGMFSVAMIFIVEHLGNVLQVAISFSGITSGASYGLFLVGMFFPWVSSKGATIGAVSGLVFMLVTVVGNSIAIASSALHYDSLPTRTDGCFRNSTPSAGFPTSSSPTVSPADADVFPLFKVSYFHFTVLGMAVTALVSLAASFLTGADKVADADPDLFSPVVARYLPRHRENQKRSEAEALGTPLQTLQEYKVVPTTDERTTT